jgi:Tfp pilus tip-associated adhesin PilY1
MKRRNSVLLPAAAVLAAALLFSQGAFADDRKLLYSNSAAPPNVMVIVANTGSMATCVSGQTLKNGATCPSTADFTSYTYGYPLAPGGANDSPDSKMGTAKSAIANILYTSGSNFNWGLTTFSVSKQNMAKSSSFAKRYTFEVQTDPSGASEWFHQTPGTLIDFQPSGSSIASPVTEGYPSSGVNRRTYQVVPWGGSTTYTASLAGQESWLQGSTDTLRQPYLLDVGGSTTSVRTLVTYPGVGPPGQISGSYQEFRITYISTTQASGNPFQITHCNTLATCTQTITVMKTVYQCNPSKSCASGRTAATNYSFDPSLGPSAGVSSNDYMMTFVVPTSYCAETLTGSSCTYPQLYSYCDTGSNCQVGQEMGWVYYNDPNMTASSNEDGWFWHQTTNHNPSGNSTSSLPMVMINHPYSPFYPLYTTSTFPLIYSPDQSSIPCMLRALRPTSSLVTNGTGTGTAGTEWDNYKIVDGAAGGNSTAGCDKLVDGAYQTSTFYYSGGAFQPNFSSQAIPVVTPFDHSGGKIFFNGLLSNVWNYYAGSNSQSGQSPTKIVCADTSKEPINPIDGFNVGRRPDDPFCSCRPSYVILITDSLLQTTGNQLKFTNGGDLYNSPSTDPDYWLSSSGIGVPVFVIGFAIPSGNEGANACTLKGSGVSPYGPVSGNVGECIADRTGAQKYTGKDGSAGNKTARQGYYTATDGASLGAALNSILSSLSNANRDFATATIPSVSSTSEGIAYLSEFIPRNNRSIWSGHLRAFLLNSTGQVQAAADGSLKPDTTNFTYWSTPNAATGFLLWDAGVTQSGISTNGLLDSGCLGAVCTSTTQPSETQMINPNTILAANSAWSDNVHDQGNLFSGTVPGRNVFFGVKPGDPGCTPSPLKYSCLVQVPVGSGGNSTTEPYSVTTAVTTPTWWSTVRDGSSYVNIPSLLSIGQSTNHAGNATSEAGNNRDQALQNTFSFLRGNRDPVVVDLAISDLFTAANKTCASLNGLLDSSNSTTSPCYYGDVLGDIFHSNPAIVAAPANFRYYLAQDSGSASPGTYADRGKSYQSFFTAYAHRRKILYAGANDALLHAFDVGVYNGDSSTYTPTGGTSTCPLCGHYDYGSGREIFAFAPLAGLNKAYTLAHTISQDWTIDGAPSVDDVYIDVTRVGTSSTSQGVAASGAGADSDASGASPASTSHSWRTVLIGAEREGGLDSSGSGVVSGTPGKGGSVFALDITDPDTAAHMAQTSSVGGTVGNSPECLVNNFTPGGALPTGCTVAEYPRILWEIRDDQATLDTAAYPNELSTSPAATTQDLGMTWSQPIIGRVKITVGSSARDFFVAIFGGGFDHSTLSIPGANLSGYTGNFLYMVDIETGRIIYKKNLGQWNSGASGTTTQGNLAAAAPGSPAVIDINGDGYLDTVYIGDTQGRLWKVDLTASATLNSSTNRVDTTYWNPVLFFDEYLNSTTQGTNARQPIFSRPAVFFKGTSTSGTAQLGIAFGTGDRDDMPQLTDTRSNMFIVLADPPTKGSFPVTLADLTLASLIANNCTASNCLNANGYYVALPTPSGGTTAPIVNTDALVFNQQIFFNVFQRSTATGSCNDIGQAYFYRLNYLTGESTYTNPDGSVKANDTAGTGVEVASTPIVYEDTKIYVVSATDDTSVHNVGGGNPPAAKVKSWKEQ